MKYINFKDAKIELKKEFGNTLDVDYLFCELFNVNFTELNFFEQISKKDFLKAKKIAYLNAKKHIPLQKIFKRAYFLNRPFYVNCNVLTPRFETELLVLEATKVLMQNKKENLKVLDLCCGSGVILISLYCETMKNYVFEGVDISSKALKVSKINAKAHNAKVKFFKSNMFKNIHSKYDLIVSNPPYIKTAEIKDLDDEVKFFDPTISLDGKEDGLFYYYEIFNNIENFLTENGVLILEFGYNQAKALKNLFEKKFKDVKIIKDYNNIERILVCKECYVR